MKTLMRTDKNNNTVQALRRPSFNLKFSFYLLDIFVINQFSSHFLDIDIELLMLILFVCLPYFILFLIFTP